MLSVHACGPGALVQDAGRPGWAHLGVPRSGWLDGSAARLALRLLGEPEDAAVVEVLLGGLEVEVSHDRWVCVTGADVPLVAAGRRVGRGAPVRLRAGDRLRLGTAAAGARAYLAVAGGIAVPPVLGSRATDTLGGLGPAPLRPGDVLPLGRPLGPPAPVDLPAPARPPAAPLRLLPGPRAAWIADALPALRATSYVVQPASDRVGLRLDGAPLRRAPGYEGRELASEAMVLGSVQVPPDGRPVVMLADHPTTGGYPVVAVVHPDDVARCGQLRPGDPVRFA